MKLLTWLSRRRFPYEPLITVEVSKSRLLHNLNEFRKLAPNNSVAPVLKSNAYGHGLLEIASILEQESRIPFFVVDSYFEAVALRARRIKTPILIIGYTRPETIAQSNLRNTAFVITSIETLAKLAGRKPPCPEEGFSGNGHTLSEIPTRRTVRIHLKIDTGMRRQGILPGEIESAIELIKANPHLVVEGACTHLSDADDQDTSFTDGQIGLWNKIAKRIHTAFPHITYLHVSATDGHQFTKEIGANVSRLGIGLYGLSENKEILKRVDLRPVMKIKTIVTGLKQLKRGESIGYGNTFTADKDILTATIPFGYFEGLDRRLSNKGAVEVGAKALLCPIIGRVSMNISTIDISNTSGVKVGDEVVVIGDDASKLNSFAHMAELCGTITYEGAVKIPGHLKRVVVD